MHPISLRLTSIVLLLAAPIAPATMIVEYDIANADGLTAQVARLADGVSAGPLALVGENASSGDQTGVVAARNWTAGASGNPLKYIEFAVTPEAGYAVDYGTISFALFREDGKRDKKGADFWDLYASADGFATPGLRLLTADISNSDDYGQVTFKNKDVSALGLQSGPVTFRFFARNPEGAQGYAGLGDTSGGSFDGTGSNVIVTGDVIPFTSLVVPEPAALLLLLGGLPLIARRRV